MSDQEDRVVPPAANTSEAPTRRQFIARAFTAAAVLVVPAAITTSAPSVALAQDKNPDKYPAPTRTSDLPPASPSASRQAYPPPGPSVSSSRIFIHQTSRPPASPPPTSRGAVIKEESVNPRKSKSSKGIDSF